MIPLGNSRISCRRSWLPTSHHRGRPAASVFQERHQLSGMQKYPPYLRRNRPPWRKKTSSFNTDGLGTCHDYHTLYCPQHHPVDRRLHHIINIDCFHPVPVRVSWVSGMLCHHVCLCSQEQKAGVADMITPCKPCSLKQIAWS